MNAGVRYLFRLQANFGLTFIFFSTFGVTASQVISKNSLEASFLYHDRMGKLFVFKIQTERETQADEKTRGHAYNDVATCLKVMEVLKVLILFLFQVQI